MIKWDEKDIEERLAEELGERFGENIYLIDTQVNIGVGKIDILAYAPETKHIAVIEVKNVPVDECAIAQVMRYMVGVNDYLNDIIDKYHLEDITKIKGYLVGPSITDSATASLRYVQTGISFYECKVKIDIKLRKGCFSRNKKTPSYKPDEFYDAIKEAIEDAKYDYEQLKKLPEAREGENGNISADTD